MTSSQCVRRVICLPKTGSSFVARIFLRHNAIHEYDFSNIAYNALNAIKDKYIASEYIRKRGIFLSDKIDVSTSLVFFLPHFPDLVSTSASIYLVRDPFDWIVSMIQYAYKTFSIGELHQDESWRINYGRLFVTDIDKCIHLLSQPNEQANFIRSFSKELLFRWLYYTQLIIDAASKVDLSTNNVFLTSRLSSIEFFEDACRLFGYNATPPLMLFLKVNPTIPHSYIYDKVNKSLPGLSDKPLLCLNNIREYILSIHDLFPSSGNDPNFL